MLRDQAVAKSGATQILGGVMTSLSLEVREPVESHQQADREDLGQALAAFLHARPRLWAIAYKTLGNVSDVEDVLQEAWIRWQRTDRARVANPAAFLAVTTTRLALNTATMAYARHEATVDPQSLDAVQPDDDRASRATETDEVARVMKHLLATLSPAELAAYLLRKAFDYPYARIAAALDVRQDLARQLVCRAQRGIRTRAPRPVNSDVVRRHIAALRLGSCTGRVDLLEHELRARIP